MKLHPTIASLFTALAITFATSKDAQASDARTEALVTQLLTDYPYYVDNPSSITTLLEIVDANYINGIGAIAAGRIVDNVVTQNLGEQDLIKAVNAAKGFIPRARVDYVVKAALKLTSENDPQALGAARILVGGLNKDQLDSIANFPCPTNTQPLKMSTAELVSSLFALDAYHGGEIATPLIPYADTKILLDRVYKLALQPDTLDDAQFLIDHMSTAQLEDIADSPELSLQAAQIVDEVIRAIMRRPVLHAGPGQAAVLTIDGAIGALRPLIRVGDDSVLAPLATALFTSGRTNEAKKLAALAGVPEPRSSRALMGPQQSPEVPARTTPSPVLH